MTLVDDVLPILDDARGLIADVGLCPYSVSIRVITWSGTAIGRGTRAVADTPLYVAGNKNPQVRQKSGRSVMPGGLYSTNTFEIGPITPPFSGGGVATTTLDPALTSTPTEIFYLLTGPGLPSGGALFKKIEERFDSPFRYMVTVEITGAE